MSNTWCWMIGAIGLAACSQNALPPLSLVVSKEPADVAKCPFGGSVVSSGLDDNHNGMLDDGEITNRTTVCNDPPGAPPPPTLVRLVPEPAGAHCDLAGTAVQFGPDRNGNSRLDDGEVEHIEYACREPLLTRLASEPPGPHCFAGGIAFLLGRDRNHDDQLADGEVEVTEYECSDELARDVVVHTAADAAALANIAIIAGSLAIDDTALIELQLPRLVQLRGSLEIKHNDSLVHLELPALQVVEGKLALEFDPELASIALPQLHRVGSLVVNRDPALHDLSGLPALTTVATDLQISGNDTLASVDLPVSRIGGDLTIDGNAQLTHTSWLVAGRMGSLHVASNPQLQSLDLAGTAMDRLTAILNITISANHQLGHVSVDGDDVDAIGIYDNPYLAEVAVTARQVRGDVLLLGNGVLRLTLSARSQRDFPIGGRLVLSGPVETLTTPFPLSVDRDCTLDLTHLASVGQNQIAHVGGMLHFTNNPRLTEIATSPRNGIEVSGNHALSTLSLPVNDEIDGDVIIQNNAILEAVDFEGLTRIVGYVYVWYNPALKNVFGPSLRLISGDLNFNGNDSLSDLGLTSATHLGGLRLQNCASVKELDLPALTDAGLFGVFVFNNATLGHLRFPLLRGLDFRVFNNPVLPACEVRALFSRLLGEHHESGNDEAAVCGS